MEHRELTRSKGLRGEIVPPPDKSISHRAVMFASIAEGKSIVRNFLRAADPLSTVQAMKMLGTDVEEEGARDLIIKGKGLYGLREPFDVIDCGNSGTTIRLLSGILSGNLFLSVLTGDDYLKQRPMARIVTPLKQMGAHILGRADDRYPPLAVRGARLSSMQYAMPVASAQLKSCLMLAGLYSDGITSLTEPYKSRDHTERMLGAMGALVSVHGLTVTIKGGSPLKPSDITVPADFSSAAFFIAGALVVPRSEITIQGVGINPTRTGLLHVLEEMGAAVDLVNIRDVSGEPVADIHCKTASNLKAVRVGKETIPSIIDEFPILCVLATQAEGVTEIRGAGELRVKESDRITAMASELKKFGVELEEYPDGISIKGNSMVRGAQVESYGDHRIAMSLSIAALVAQGTTRINDTSCVDISFPGFFEMLESLTRGA